MNSSINIDKPDEFINIITESIFEKKGSDVVSVDLQKVEQSITDYFIICHGDTNTQVDAIADNIIYKIKKDTGISPWHKEGFENAQWILIDYSNVIIHVFQKEQRDFYNLEDLWADGEVKRLEDIKN